MRPIPVRFAQHSIGKRLTGRKQWLYEPYGVYYYYAALEKAEEFRKPGATYLIIDIGGSTTDLSVVQVKEKGSELGPVPSCASIPIGGSNFDRFLLDEFLGSDLPESPEELAELLDQVEQAKVAVATGKRSHRLALGDRKFEVTPQLLEDRLRRFWSVEVNGSTLEAGLTTFLEQVRHRTENDRLFHPFERFERVFLAGGAVQPAAVQKLIHQQLVRHGVLSNRNPPELPRLTSPSSVTAVGLAVELVPRMEQLQLERADEVYAEIRDENDQVYAFRLNDVELLDQSNPSSDPDQGRRSGETLIYNKRVREVFGTRESDKIKVEPVPGKRHGYAPYQLGASRPSRFKFRFRNDLQDVWQEGALEYPVNAERVGQLKDVVELGLSTVLYQPVTRQDDRPPSSHLRVKPSLFWQYKGRERNRVDPRDQNGDDPARGAHPVSLRRGSESGEVHICIDFGMSNTCVAIVAPGRAIPKADDLKILPVASGVEQDSKTLPKRKGARKDAELTTTSRFVELPSPILPQHATTDVAVSAIAAAEPAGEAEHALIQAAARAGAQAAFDVEARWRSIEDQLRTRESSLEARIAEVQQSYSALEERLAAETRRGPDIDQSVRAAVATPIQELTGVLEKLLRPRSEERAPEGKPVHPRGRAEDEALQSESALGRARPSGHRRGLGEEPLDELVRDFKAFLKEEGEKNGRLLHYPDRAIRAAIAQCENSRGRLTILAGPPGTGKSTLVRLLAAFYNPDLYQEGDLDPYFLLQPVSPAWFSSTSLLGGYSEVDGRFRGTEFLHHLYRADVHREMTAGTDPRMFFVCLDEFNLAQPEQYFAEFLSRMEAPENSRERELVLCAKEDAPDLEDDIKVRIGSNLRFFGAINIDASTHQLSAKVLDRAHLVRLTPSQEDLRKVAEHLSAQYEIPWFHKEMSALLDSLHNLGTAARTPIGYRALEKSYAYAVRFSSSAAIDIMDDVLCSYLLTRLPGLLVVQRGYDRAHEMIESVREGLPGQVA